MDYDEFDALIFDCDGTLVDSLLAHETAWLEVLNAHGIPFTHERMYELGGVPTYETLEILSEDAGGLDVDMAVVAAEKEQRFLQIYPDMIGAAEPVVEIARHYFGEKPMAVATGGDSNIVAAMLERVGIDELFDTIVGAEHVNNHKPAPDVYLEAARRLGVVPERCAGFDDADRGLDAARAAGMHAVDVREIWEPSRVFNP